MSTSLSISDWIFIALGTTTTLVFLFYREWLLKKRTSLVLLVWNLLLFALGYILPYLDVGNPKIVIMLKVSLLCHLIFAVMLKLFRKIYRRDPVDTFWTMDPSLMRDGFFNGIYIFLSVVSAPMIVGYGII